LRYANERTDTQVDKDGSHHSLAAGGRVITDASLGAAAYTEGDSDVILFHIYAS